MRSMMRYPRAAVERAMAKKVTWWQAAEILGISDRHMRRWRGGKGGFGSEGLFALRVVGLYRDRYPDLNVQHFHEKLSDQHQIELSYSWVKQALQGAGLVPRGRTTGCIASGVRDDRCRGCLTATLLTMTVNN